VPACDEHNTKCSKDDEVAAYVITIADKANELGASQFLKKGVRAITGNKGLIDSIFKKIEVQQMPGGGQVATFEFDAERVERVMERIARGLFFHEFGRRWEYPLSLISDWPLMSDLSTNPYRDLFQQLDPRFNQLPRRGADPSVFWYDWLPRDRGDCDLMLRTCFYGGLGYIAFPG
jgi:hypothetical protein